MWTALSYLIRIILIALVFIIIALLVLLVILPGTYILTGRFDDEDTSLNLTVGSAFRIFGFRISYDREKALTGSLSFSGFKIFDITGIESSGSGEKNKKKRKKVITDENNAKDAQTHRPVISRLREQADELYDLFSDNKRAYEIETVKRYISELLRSFIPKKGKISIDYGSGDPYKTAKTAELAAFVYTVMGDTLDFTPCLSEKMLKISADCKGRIRIFRALIILIRFHFNKRVKSFTAALKQRSQEVVGVLKNSGV